jgi:hypothetical protein
VKEKEMTSKVISTTPTYNPVCYHTDDEKECNCWSTNYTIDHLKQHLATVSHSFILDNGKHVKSRKYYDQAFHLLKIGAFKPALPFIIYLSDLENDSFLIKELVEAGKDNETLGYVLRQAVGRIFEDINSELYHNSISKVLKVKIEK